VGEGVETLSDHLYIFMEEKDTPRSGSVGDGRSPARGECARPPPRWKIKERDDYLLRTAATTAAWSWEASTTTTELGVEEDAENLHRDMTAICNASMTQTTVGTGRSRAVYLWTLDIATRGQSLCAIGRTVS
jgi:hypothetical protein